MIFMISKSGLVVGCYLWQLALSRIENLSATMGYEIDVFFF